MSKIFASGDIVRYKKRKKGTRRVARGGEVDDDGATTGYITTPGKVYIAKGKIGGLGDLAIPVRIEDGTIRQIPYSSLTPGYADKVTFQEKLGDTTEWQGTKLVVTKVGKTIKVTGRAILDDLFVPVVESDGHIIKLQVKDLEGVRR